LLQFYTLMYFSWLYESLVCYSRISDIYLHVLSLDQPFGIHFQMSSESQKNWDWEHFSAVTEQTTFQAVLMCSAH